MLSKPRLLIVENEATARRILVDLFSNPPPELRDAYAVAAFEVVAAASGEEADVLLHNAASTLCPYDVLLLDLGLPRLASEEGDDPEIGKELLSSLDGRNKWSCNAVIVHSGYADATTILHSLKAGVADFEPKPSDIRSVFQCVAQVFKKSRVGLEGRWNDYLRLRADRRTLISRAQTADEIARVVSDGTGRVVLLAERLEALFLEHFHINVEREQDNPLCRRLRELKDAATETAFACADKRRRVGLGATDRTCVALEATVRSVIDTVRSGLALYHLRVRLPDRCHTIHAFARELVIILEEMLSTAMKYAREGSELSIEVQREGEFMTISTFWEPLPSEPTSKIGGSGDREPAQIGQCSAEGELDIAQWLIQNIGGHLDVTTGTLGTTATLKLPVTADDEPSDRR